MAGEGLGVRAKGSRVVPRSPSVPVRTRGSFSSAALAGGTDGEIVHPTDGPSGDRALQPGRDRTALAATLGNRPTVCGADRSGQAEVLLPDHAALHLRRHAHRT